MLAFRRLVLLAATCGVLAQDFASLYIPGAGGSDGDWGSQSLSADFLGAGSDGRTTWALQVPTGIPSEEQAFSGTATVVEASDYVSLGLAVDDVTQTVTYDVACTISASVALCSAGANGEFGSDLTTETVSKFAVQLGSTPTPTPTPGASSGQSSGTGLTTVKSSQASGTSPSASTNSTSGASERWEVPLYTIFIVSILTGILGIA